MTREASMTGADARTDSLHRRVLLVGGVIPIVIAAVSTIAMISWIPELPDPIAIHWSGSGVDGYGSAWPMVLLPLGLVLVFTVFAVVASWKPTVNHRLSANQKFVLVTGVWMSILLSVGIGGSVFMQRGLDDASRVGGVDVYLLVGALAGFALAVLCWFLLPAADRNPQVASDPEPMDVQATEHVSWTQTVLIAHVALVLITVAIIGAIIAVIITAISAPDGFWFAASSAIVMVLLLLGTGSWRVSADRRGLVVRSSLGWPRATIPLSDIRAAQVVTVNPSADFGGWGWRWDAAGRSGIIMRRGEAIQVTRSSGKKFVVTVDDAATGAAVLAALLPAQRK